MTAYLLAFLRALEIAIPPAPGFHHVISIASLGAPEGRDQLALYVRPLVTAGRETEIIFDPDDFSKPIDQLVAECCEVYVRAKAIAA